MKTFLLSLLSIFSVIVFFGCQRHTAFLIYHNPEDKPLLVFPLIKQKSKDWDKELEKGLIHFEGFKPRPYYCCAGVKTIGYGCTDRRVISKGWISEKDARALLLREVEEVRKEVKRQVRVKLSENQLNALTSFAFNCGFSNLRKLVNGKGRLNSGNYKSIEKILPLYRRAAGKVRKGIERRRAWELALWRGEIQNK